MSGLTSKKWLRNYKKWLRNYTLPVGALILRLSGLDSGRNQDRKTDFRPGSTIA
jgi:hypothetical protein